ncbi:MAG: copper amine oxidase [Armatimonadetes bacterium]|nr:copper amine oxidase [Armatimonadota bacterium]
MLKKTSLRVTVLVTVVVTALVFPGRAPALAAPDLEQALDRAASYLLAQDKRQDKPLTPWSYVALAAAGKSLANTRAEESCAGLLAYLAQSPSASTADYCTLVFGVIAAGKDPSSYRGDNLVQKIQAAQLPDGKFADNIDGSGQGENGEQVLVNAHIWAVLALRAAGAPIPDAAKAREWLLARQHDRGSFNWYLGETSPDVDSTGMALMALGALGEGKESPAVQKAVAYLRGVQENDGGFTSWGVANPESISTVIQGLLAAGFDPAGEQMRKPGGDPVTALLDFQLPDGSFAHTKGSGANEMATQQALLALAGVHSGKALPDRLAEQAKSSAVPVPVPEKPETKEIRFPVGAREYVTVEEGGRRRVEKVDAAPFIENGRTYVPVRYLALALGIPENGIAWAAETKTVTLSKNGITLTMFAGGNALFINGVAQPPLDAAPLLRDGRVYLPARRVAEAFGYEVQWEKTSQTVVVKSRN